MNILSYTSQLGYNFKLSQYNLQSYTRYIDSILHHRNRKEVMMEPIPPEVGKLKFSIKRVSNFMTKLTPTYEMYIKLREGVKVNLI